MNHKQRLIAFIFIFILYIPNLHGQIFSRGFGFITSTNSDSRSVNIIDVNNDGLEDIFISNGLKDGQNDFMYFNEGGNFFRDSNTGNINKDNAASVGASFADYDNDGDLDAYVTNWYGETNHLYENNGSGTFTKKANSNTSLGSFSEAATWGDYDGDGWLDLYVTNSASSKENYLFRNKQNGSFERITSGALLNEKDPSRGANWIDINMDGHLDLFIVNENNTPNDMYFNDGKGGFVKNISGSVVVLSRSSMGSSWGDIDNDGDFDLFVTNAGFFAEQSNYLFLNDGKGKMERVSLGPIVTSGGCSFGSSFGDYDNDGDLDLIVTNGFCKTKLKDWLYENQGDGTFIQRNDLLPGLGEVCSYGAAWGDLNNDGFLELVIAHCKNDANSPEPFNSLFLNEGNGNNWLKVKLEGKNANKDAIGAKIWAKATIDEQEVWQLRHISSQSGYAGQNSLVVHFGLKNAEKVDSLKIEWPNGPTQIIGNIFANQQIEIVEGGLLTSNSSIKTSAFNFEIAPNPISKLDTSLNLNLKGMGSGNEDFQIRIYDMLGKQVWKKTYQQESNRNIQLQKSGLGLSTGIYRVSIEWEQSLQTKTIVIQ
jgi:hypothetical protein